MKVLRWMIAFAGLWEFGDIAALLIPDFGRIPGYLWNHILAGLLLMIVGIRAAWTTNAVTARTMSWIAASTGIWLMVSSFILRYPATDVGLWNDLLVGAIAFVLGTWTALASPQ